jgi:hypothetical protein
MSVNQLLVPNSLDLFCRSITPARAGPATVNTALPAVTFVSGAGLVNFAAYIPTAGLKLVTLMLTLTSDVGTESIEAFEFDVNYAGVTVSKVLQSSVAAQPGYVSQNLSTTIAIQCDGASQLALFGAVTCSAAAASSIVTGVATSYIQIVAL